MAHLISINCSRFISVILLSLVAQRSIVNATFVRSTFINRTTNGVAVDIYNSSVQIEQCTMSNNSNGAIYFSGYNSRSLTIDRSLFSNNSYYYCYYYPGYYYYGGEAIRIH